MKNPVLQSKSFRKALKLKKKIIRLEDKLDLAALYAAGELNSNKTAIMSRINLHMKMDAISSLKRSS